MLSEYEKAPEVTRKRLYLDAVEEVMANSSKIMMDVEGGNNMMYLPLDKLMEARGNSPMGRSGGLTSTDRDIIAEQVLDQLRRELTASARRREGR